MSHTTGRNFPLSLELEQLKPQPLVKLGDKRPTPLEIANRIPQWVTWNLKRVLTANVHYEHQLYGPDNSYLQSIFDMGRQFSVIPQALLRQPFSYGKDANPLNISTSSAGGEHPSRKVKGREHRLYPDFIVVKVIPTDVQDARQHYVCCVVEIKLEDKVARQPAAEDGVQDDAAGQDQVLGTESQLVRYMTFLQKHRYIDPELKGYLLKGSTFAKYQIQGGEVHSDGTYTSMFEDGDPLTMSLCEIAHDEWDRDDVADCVPVPTRVPADYDPLPGLE